MKWSERIGRAGLTVLAMALVAIPAAAEDPIATELAVADAEDFLGIWNIKMDVMGNEFSMILSLTDVDGKVGATLDSEQQAEALAIPEIIKTDDGGLELTGELKFGSSFSLDIILNIVRDGDGLGGTIKDQGGIFNAELVGTPMTEEELDSVQGKRPDPTETRLNIDGKKIRIGFANLEMGTSDWDLFQNVADGEIYTFTLSRATKIYTDFDMSFGDTVIKAGNVAADYPGVYSVWLKKVGDGWSLVFNEQPDIWGTRHKPEHDVAEVPLTLGEVDGEPQEKFMIELEQEGDDAGTLTLRWGSHEWSAKFTLRDGTASAS